MKQPENSREWLRYYEKLKVKNEDAYHSDDCDKQASVLVWHEINEDDDSTFPDDDRLVLVTFENFSSVIIGRFDRDDDGGGTWRIGDVDESFVEHGLFVNGWWELPKREDKPNVE